MLDKRGNSNTPERIALIQDFTACFGRERIDHVPANRAFVAEQWLEFRNRNRIPYHIRIRNNFRLFCPRKQKEVTAMHLFHGMKNGELRRYQKIAKTHGAHCHIRK